MSVHHSVAVQIRMNKALLDWVEANHKLHGFNSRSELIRQAVRDFRERKLGSELPSIPDSEIPQDVDEPVDQEGPADTPVDTVASHRSDGSPPASIEPLEPADADEQEAHEELSEPFIDTEPASESEGPAPSSSEPEEQTVTMDNTPVSTNRKVPIQMAQLADRKERSSPLVVEDDEDAIPVARLPAELLINDDDDDEE